MEQLEENKWSMYMYAAKYDTSYVYNCRQPAETDRKCRTDYEFMY